MTVYESFSFLFDRLLEYLHGFLGSINGARQGLPRLVRIVEPVAVFGGPPFPQDMGPVVERPHLPEDVISTPMSFART